nr:hypothetical protein [Candidatus Methylobacter favarea]
MKQMPRDEFEEISGRHILFLIHAKHNSDATRFQDQDEWALQVKAPLAIRLNILPKLSIYL